MGGETANLSKTRANLCQIVPLYAPPLFLARKRARAVAERPLTDSFLIPLLPRRLFGLVFFRQGHGDGERGKEGEKFPNPIAYSFPLSLSLGSGRGGSGSSKKFKIAAGG